MLLALILLATPGPTVTIDAFGPGCVDRGHTSINAITVVLDHFRNRDGGAYIVESGLSALSDGHRVVFVPDKLTDGTLTKKHLGALQEKGEVLDAEFPILIGPWEWNFQLERKGHFDWLSMLEKSWKYPDLDKVVGQLRKHGPLYVVERPGAPPPSADLLGLQLRHEGHLGGGDGLGLALNGLCEDGGHALLAGVARAGGQQDRDEDEPGYHRKPSALPIDSKRVSTDGGSGEFNAASTSWSAYTATAEYSITLRSS